MNSAGVAVNTCINTRIGSRGEYNGEYNVFTEYKRGVGGSEHTWKPSQDEPPDGEQTPEHPQTATPAPAPAPAPALEQPDTDRLIA